jgi:hypothetical protein
LKGIYFINDRVELDGLSREESFQLQKQALIEFMEQQQIEPVVLNPCQLNSHYTIPHALFYDLKDSGKQLDCLAFYSPAVLDDFITTYPARWLLIRSYFDQVLAVCHDTTYS